MRGVARQCDGVNGLGDGRGIMKRSEPGCANANLVDLNARNGAKRLADAANAGAAMHPVDSHGEFRPFFFRHIDLMISGGRRFKLRIACWGGGKIERRR
jgi:hypothetical protein